jgi:hypothetical protein
MKASRQRKLFSSARTSSRRAGSARVRYIEAWLTRYTRSATDGQQSNPAPQK